MDGTKVKDLNEYTYVADKNHLGKPEEWAIQTSNVNAGENLKVGDLDNKIIRVIITSENPVQDGQTDVTEPLLVISDVHIDFLRPEVTLAVADNEVLEAGAGRTTDCDLKTLETTVKFWNTLDMTELGAAARGDIYPNEGNELSEELRYEGERPAFYEISAAHPFRLHGIKVSNVSDPTKEDKFFDFAEIASKNGKIGKDVTKFTTGALVGQDSLITYRIPREFFVEANGEKFANEYKVTMTYAFEPLTVGTF